jgi:hypothetical protein
MGASLLPYLQLKVHSLIQGREWPSIRVVGAYDRGCQISHLEKNDKMFNWQRPTAEVVDGALLLKCFPGRDYVHHYALIVATYLAMVGRFRGQVSYQLPDEASCLAVTGSIRLDPRGVAAVIVGWGLPQLAGADGWTADGGLAWKRASWAGVPVLHVGFFHSIWGDVAGRVVARLAELGARRVVYVGKVGALRPGLRPNRSLATGCESLVGRRLVRWSGLFDGLAAANPDVVAGVHVTSPSTLLESRAWLARHRAHAFVDPEIGHMAAAAAEAGVRFGYLHVISNNLARPYEQDLSNERGPAVLHARGRLLARAKELIGRRLGELA